MPDSAGVGREVTQDPIQQLLNLIERIANDQEKRMEFVEKHVSSLDKRVQTVESRTAGLVA